MQPEYIDTIAYTVFGPVMYDKSFSGSRKTNNKYYAVRWKGHDAGNELMVFNGLASCEKLFGLSTGHQMAAHTRTKCCFCL